MESIQAIKGMNDILPDQIGWWHLVEGAAREVLENFGYREIRTPIVEKTELFARSIGENTDIVEKEMYTFADRKGELLTLRPEATASIVRCFIQHNLQADPVARKFYALGPMFRYERPQKGRYRQFYQLDAEVFGVDDPLLDAEIMYMLQVFLERLGLPGVSLNINSLGCAQCRKPYRSVLQQFLLANGGDFCPDCERRAHVNPLRVFDCKVERCQKIIEGAPMLLTSICSDCGNHFEQVQDCLTRLHTPFVINPRMVRGLDYYMRTTFEIVTDRLGAQNAVGGGGRYDGLMKDLGGPDMPGIGFAIGLERLILLLQQQRAEEKRTAKIFIATLGEAARQQGFLLAQELRAGGLETELEYARSSLKSQMRRADKLGVEYVVMIGEDEMRQGAAQVRDMANKSQVSIALDGAARLIQQMCKEAGAESRR